MRITLADGDDNPTSFPIYVTQNEFKQYVKTNDADHKKIYSALWGVEGTEGIIKTVNDISLYMKIGFAILTVAIPILSTLLMKWIGV